MQARMVEKSFFNFTEAWRTCKFTIKKCAEFSSLVILLKKGAKKSTSGMKLGKIYFKKTLEEKAFFTEV